MSNMGNQLVANLIKAISHPTRLHIIKLLKERPLCVCDIIEQIGSEQSNTSQHLTVLKNQGIVESRKDGLMMIYSIKNAKIYEIIDIAEEILLKQIEETSRLLKKGN